MDFPSPLTWWLLAGVLAAAEMASGTFYLLMLALAAVAAALAAHVGAGPELQFVIAGLVGVAAVLLLRRRRAARRGARVALSADRSLHLDIGERVDVGAWDAEGRTTLQWRGAPWQARWAGNGPARPGAHVIQAVDGNLLLLDR